MLLRCLLPVLACRQAARSCGLAWSNKPGLLDTILERVWCRDYLAVLFGDRLYWHARARFYAILGVVSGDGRQ